MTSGFTLHVSVDARSALQLTEILVVPRSRRTSNGSVLDRLHRDLRAERNGPRETIESRSNPATQQKINIYTKANYKSSLAIVEMNERNSSSSSSSEREGRTRPTRTQASGRKDDEFAFARFLSFLSSLWVCGCRKREKKGRQREKQTNTARKKKK